jgi:hypothetical protein
MCNCRKNKRVETKVITGAPPPEPQVIQLPVEDHFNNIDTIEPIQNGQGTTGQNTES